MQTSLHLSLPYQCTHLMQDSTGLLHTPDHQGRVQHHLPNLAPSHPDPPAEVSAAPTTKTPKRRIVNESPQPSGPEAPKEILIVASRLKDYVRAKSGYNTSETVLAPLSDIVRRAVDEAIRSAQRDERVTVLDRDIPVP